MENFDVVVVGSGPGGYVAAIRCAQLGFKTAIIERYNTLGGTCLNVGCIPSKALLDSSEHFYNASHTFKEHGIDVGSLNVNLEQMIKRKAGVVKQTSDGILFLMKKNKITTYFGHGTFVSKDTVEVALNDGNKTTLSAKKFVIATGSKPIVLPGMEIDKKRIITSTEALEMKEVPKNLILVGGGVIGLELGSVYARLGAKVSVLEYADSIIPTMDKSLGKELQKSLTKIGFEFFLNHKVLEVKNKGKEVLVKASDKVGKEVQFNG
ncbi:MAG: dihydrolipoyl dehydrogenase family protein, partial [Bacteroidota bacterium]